MQKDSFKEDFIKIIPFGGCGEIGMNITLFSIHDRHFLVDCGALFPDASQLGVQLVLPNTRYLDENNIQIEAWLITHGHEDHIGALPYLFKKYPAPIYGTKLTIELIKLKFEEARIKNASMTVWNFYKTVFFRDIRVTPFMVNHSIADAAGLFIETPLGNILHTGDFRIDATPPEKIMTHESIKKVVGNKKVRVMLSDSTNSFQMGTDKSESDILPSLEDIMRKEKGTVIIGTFASSIWRIRNVMDAAKATNRKVALFGRTMRRNVEIAKRLGFLHFNDKMVMEIEDTKNLPRDQLCILCTGSQGEPFSGLHRLTWNTISDFEITYEDVVVFSSRIIPGNEKSIESLVTQLTRTGCRVITPKESNSIHVSGHGFQEDLKKCIMAANPVSFMPVHGTYRHLRKHIDLAMECGISPQNCLLVENGDVAALGPDITAIIDTVTNGRDLVCPGGVFPINSSIYKDRVSLVETGVVAVSFVISKNNSTLACNPLVSLKGVNLNDFELAQTCVKLFASTQKSVAKRKKTGDSILREALRIAIRRHIEDVLKFKTTVLVLMHKV